MNKKKCVVLMEKDGIGLVYQPDENKLFEEYCVATGFEGLDKSWRNGYYCATFRGALATWLRLIDDKDIYLKSKEEQKSPFTFTELEVIASCALQNLDEDGVEYTKYDISDEDLWKRVKGNFTVGQESEDEDDE